ncbi:MAG TPA: C4-type zinc ribbon domain-containing protein [Candidatus Acidoferrum sp.]|nr:C4-type zinc ribbon domain-containing protein [Candidatus Acidoferrum sp.]
MNELFQNLIKLQSLEFGDRKDAQAEAAIAALRAQIPSQILGHYDRLVARGKKGVAAVRGQVCSGCHMQVPLGVVMTLRHEEDIQLCENCGRYLYLPSVDEAEQVETASAPKTARKARKSKKSLQMA